MFICDNRKEAVQYYVSTTITSDSITTSNPKDALYSSVKEHLTSSDPRPTANQFEICITTDLMTCIEYSTFSPRSYFVVGSENSDVSRDGVSRDGVSRDGVSRDGVSRGAVGRGGVSRYRIFHPYYVKIGDSRQSMVINKKIY